MSTKKKTTKTTKTKRTAAWQTYFTTALTAATKTAFERAMDSTVTEGDDTMTDITYEAARAVKLAEKIADIAEGRNA